MRFTADEYAELADAAARAGLTTTGYVGETALAAARGVTIEGETDTGGISRAELAQLQRDLFAAQTAMTQATADLRGTPAGHATFITSRLFAAVYPEAVKIAALIGSLHWRRRAACGPDQQRRFTAEIGRRLGQPDYRPRVTQDPIAHWIDQDCWQPPSLPTTTYRAQRGFGGSSLPKVNEQSRDRNRRSATWFARNRRGGRVILYHRHVGPVLVRDWSVRMDLFTATVAASADTWKFRNAAARPNHLTVKDVRELVAAEYLRPIPAQSDYLDTATNPMPWPTRTEPRQPRGGRPMLAAERRLAEGKTAAAVSNRGPVC